MAGIRAKKPMEILSAPASISGKKEAISKVQATNTKAQRKNRTIDFLLFVKIMSNAFPLQIDG